MTLWAIQQRHQRGWSILSFTIRFSRRDAWEAWRETLFRGDEQSEHVRKARMRDGSLRAVKVVVTEA